MRIYNRINIAGVIVTLFAVIVIFACNIPFKNWVSTAFGILLSATGSLIFYLLLRQWEQHIKQCQYNMPATLFSAKPDILNSKENMQELKKALSDAKSQQKKLIEELNAAKETIHKQDANQANFDQQVADIYHELNTYKSNSEEELRRKTVLLSEYQETINQQRDVIKKKQEQISELESKVRDLNYEVKTLLQLADLGNKNTRSTSDKGTAMQAAAHSYQVDMFEEDESQASNTHIAVKTPDEASLQLKRCIDIAQKITGANRFASGSSRFKDITINNRALDLRRLFDNLRSENAGTVIVFSQKENKLLFANSQTTNLLGWSPEKFTQTFSEIIEEGKEEWKNGIATLSASTESKVRMVMKTKSGDNLLVHCHLGMIPTGAFRNHIIGVLYAV